MAEGRRSLLIVEDELLISIMIEEMAMELGWSIAASVQTVPSAIEALAHSSPALALLDINLGAGDGFGIAQVCRERGIPIVFMTGYIPSDIPEGCGNSPILAKPFTQQELGAMLERGMHVPV